uniref:Mitochondrial genome maintenance exonuclease 1 n=1 Tax=Timema douglasi TaxID=61478 RepID=A0A7R8VIN2_TIMDO|nr:unnamed protein product [Timema douglasi]
MNSFNVTHNFSHQNKNAIKLVCSRAKSTLKDKKNYGDVIKNLNKENKSWFGNLIETRSVKKKKGVSKIPEDIINSDVPLKTDLSSELWWYNKTLSDQNRTHKQVCNKSITKQLSCERSGASTLCKPSIKSEEACDQIDILNSKVPIANSQPIVSMTEKTHAKSPLFILPDIFIRNIPSFPLTNANKKPTKCLHATNNIMNLSSDSKDYLRYPSVSKILNDTMSKSAQAALDRWRNKMIAQLGEEGFLEYHKGLLSKGSLFHSTVHSYLSGATVALEPDIEGCWQSMSGVLPDITNVSVLESHVVHSQLLYRGIIDCVAEYKNKPVLIEWKKSDKQKPELENTYDAPIQLCAYLGAINYDNNYNLKKVAWCSSVVRYLATHPQMFTMKLGPSVPLRWTALLCLVLTCATCMYACVEHTEYKALSNHVVLLVLLAGLVCNNPRKHTDNTMSYFLIFVAELLWVWSSWTAGTFSLKRRVCAVDIFTLYILRRCYCTQPFFAFCKIMLKTLVLPAHIVSSTALICLSLTSAPVHGILQFFTNASHVAFSLRKQPAYNFLWNKLALISTSGSLPWAMLPLTRATHTHLPIIVTPYLWETIFSAVALMEIKYHSSLIAENERLVLISPVISPLTGCIGCRTSTDIPLNSSSGAVPGRVETTSPRPMKMMTRVNWSLSLSPLVALGHSSQERRHCNQITSRPPSQGHGIVLLREVSTQHATGVSAASLKRPYIMKSQQVPEMVCTPKEKPRKPLTITNIFNTLFPLDEVDAKRVVAFSQTSNEKETVTLAPAFVQVSHTPANAVNNSTGPWCTSPLPEGKTLVTMT